MLPNKFPTLVNSLANPFPTRMVFIFNFCSPNSQKNVVDKLISRTTTIVWANYPTFASPKIVLQNLSPSSRQLACLWIFSDHNTLVFFRLSETRFAKGTIENVRVASYFILNSISCLPYYSFLLPNRLNQEHFYLPITLGIRPTTFTHKIICG